MSIICLLIVIIALVNCKKMMSRQEVKHERLWQYKRVHLIDSLNDSELSDNIEDENDEL